MALSFEQILQQALGGGAPQPAPQQSVGITPDGRGVVAPEGSEILRPGGAGNAQGIAELMAGGGSASVGGKPIFGTAFGDVDRSGLRSGFQDVLAQADTLSRTPETAAAVQGTQAQAAQDPGRILQALQGGQPSSTSFGDVVKEITGTANNVAEREQLQKIAPALATELIKARLSANTQRFAAASPIVKEALRGAGLLPSEGQTAFEKARGKALGEQAGGKGGDSSLVGQLAASAGTDGFADAYAKALVPGSGIKDTTLVRLQQLHDTRIKNATPEEKLTTSIQGADASIGRIRRISDAFDKASAGKGGLSQGLKLALSRTPTWAGFLQNQTIPISDGLSKDEIDVVTELNALFLGMRQIADDQRPSDKDMDLFAKAIGDPLSGRDVFLAQLGAAERVLHDRGQATISSLKARNKDIRGISKELKFLKGAGATKGIPQGAVDTGRTSKGKKVFQAPDGSLHVED